MTTRIIGGLAEILGGYDALFCDLWGCFHNGLRPYPGAVAALRAARGAGVPVVLLTNAPRPAPEIVAQLDAMGAPRDAYDAVVSSGDAARAAVIAGDWGRRVHHLGPGRDAAFFHGAEVDLVALEAAESIVCTGLFDDETESPEDYAATIAAGVASGLRLLCANPDLVVDRGEKRIWCAGAIAEAYARAGGEAVYYGKPHRPIYDLARRRLGEAAGRDMAAARVLAIGDGVGTDVAGAAAAGLDCLFVTGGLAAAEVEVGGAPDPDRLAAYLGRHRAAPRYAMALLA